MNKETEAMNVGEKLKIAHVLKSSIYSGAENVVLTIMKGLREEFEFLYIATEGPIREKLEEEQVPFKLLERFDRKYLSQALNEYQPDIVHAHDFSATVLCAAVPGRFRLISHLHYDPPWVKNWNGKTLCYALCSRRIETILTVSENIFRSMVFAGKCGGKLQVIGNPVDGRKIRSLASLPALQPEEEHGCDIIFAGRFVEQKNPERFIYLVKKVKDRGWREIRAWMLGEGELLEKCRDLISNLKLQDNIELKGFQSNPYPLILRAKLLCMTSRWEGFGLVAAEANLLGVPVLSSDNSGCREILGEGAPELCRSDEEFLEKIFLLHENTEVYEQWRQRSLARAEQLDNMDRYMETMASIYQEKE